MEKEVVVVPKGFTQVFVPDGVHVFLRGLKCTSCETVSVGAGNTPEIAYQKAVESAERHKCNVIKQ